MIEYSNSSLDLLVHLMVAWVQNKLVLLKLPSTIQADAAKLFSSLLKLAVLYGAATGDISGFSSVLRAIL